eukprot:TRINITY_DN68474_c0_g1_i1.p1 TRINITY_DN68474_c0_g1~~TRINITY_DN68474_c0_g1_i1.p1  ORF type:complete len:477 (+),score=61.08 TRINITY_DN68474_c0_g1_i1:52-1482(+)
MASSLAVAMSCIASMLLLLFASHGENLAPRAQPLPRSQKDFFDLLPVDFPFSAPPQPIDLDPVASRLGAVCGSAKDLAALAIASSELHSFNVNMDGSYDLTLPDFDSLLPETAIRPLLHACEELVRLHARAVAVFHEHSLLCPRSESCIASSISHIGSIACHVVSIESVDVQGAADLFANFSSIADRARARTRRAAERLCKFHLSSSGPLLDLDQTRTELAEVLQEISSEVRIFLDHAFQALALSPAGLPMLEPLAVVLKQHAPAIRHVPIRGQRWNVLRFILEGLRRGSVAGAGVVGGLRVAEIGVEKGMTVTYLMRSVPSISEYVLVDPWHLPGKSSASNAVLEGYFHNLQAWASEEPEFQRGGRPSVRIVRLTSQDAAEHFDDGMFDLVFIDGEHGFDAVRQDIRIWKRLVRPNGGVLAGHDFSLLHPAAALAVLLECGPLSEDLARFPLETDSVGRPVLRLSTDSVWWAVRA